jgi:WbqC-like protein family
VTTLVVLQPGYLPWLGYFDLLQKADVFVHYDSGRAGQSILDVEIDDRQDWRRKYLSTVASCSSHKGPMGRLALPNKLSDDL